MELVYLWVEKYKNIHHQGFNFSPKFLVDFQPTLDKDGKVVGGDLDIQPKEHIENFFGKNINVTAIVGENGSGKSSVFELISELDSPFSSDYTIIFILREKEENFLYSKNINENINTNLEEKKLDTNYNKASISLGLDIAYMSLSSFLGNIDKLYNNINDKSLLASIFNYVNNHENKSFDFLSFSLYILPKIPELLNQEYIKKAFNFQGKPKYFKFKIKSNVKDYFSDFFKEKINEFGEAEIINNNSIYYIDINNHSALEIIKELNTMIEYEKQKFKEENNEIESNLNEDEKNGLLPEFPKRVKTQYDVDIEAVYKMPYGNVSDDESIQSKINRMTNSRINTNRKKIARNNEIINNLGSIDFILTQDKNGNIFYFSSGELSLLFYIDKLLAISKNKNDLTFLIDEIELYMHPFWQKKFMLLLNKIFNNNDYKRQLIISTHSPFILSDLPKENVIFLEKGKQVYPFENMQTFGANIHTLLSHGFFMRDGLMGEFAKSKINEIIEFHTQVEKETKDFTDLLAQYENKKTQFLHIQSIIGEEYLKQVIKNHLVEIEKILLGKDEAKNAEIARVKAYLESLEK
ncbi:MAG: hypothetical protein KU37_03725 [Sulfuricurvum sp. PC08-66]|nr:MAG: hypothetical protein KU37_03725 [Sulfuricurvum sp. PC08-66]